ncbi:MAG: FAD-dependent oxidoreductase [Actinomycetes bacterium]
MTDEAMGVLTPDVLVIGAGPAGLAVAAETAAAGLDVTVVDENELPGGQIWRQRFPGSGPASMTGAAARMKLAESVDFLGSTVCLGFRGGKDEAVLLRDGQITVVRPRAVILATGALERVLPLPGWTLPGVMTAGAAQTMLKSGGLFPFRRVVVAGSGPLLLATAAQLVRGGVGVAAVVEATRPRLDHLREIPGMLQGASIIADGLKYMVTIGRARVPVMAGYGVQRVVGTDAVERVEISRLSRDWSFQAGVAVARSISCDAVLLSHGFSSTVDLASQLGARLMWDAQRGSWRPWRGPGFETSERSVWAAGDCAGVGGAQIAVLEGTLAGLSVATRLAGSRLPAARVKRIYRRLKRLEAFRRAMDNLSRIQPGAQTWAMSETIVCRCQGTTLADVQTAISGGVTNLHGLKLWTRAGMGRCQGRSCASALRDVLTNRGGTSGACGPSDAPSVRFPVRPVMAGALGAWLVGLESDLITDDEEH